MIRAFSRLTLVCLAVIVPCISVAATIAHGDLIVTTLTSCCSGTPQPDAFHLADDGDFKGWFFTPFAVGDMATRGNEILLGHSNSGTIARIGPDGGLKGLINTPADRISGLAVASNGNIFVADGSNNRLLQLDSNGAFLDLVFLSQTAITLGIDSLDRLIFPLGTSSCCDPRELGFLDFDTGLMETVTTDFRNIFGLAVNGEGEIIVAGSKTSSSSGTGLFRLDLTGTELGTLPSPGNPRSVAVFTPEPATAAMLGLGLLGLAGYSRKRRG